MIRVSAFLVASALALTACTPAPPPKVVEKEDKLILTRVGYDALPGWSTDALEEALPALTKSCARLAKRPADRTLGPKGIGGTVAQWRPACNALRTIGSADRAAFRAYVESWFVPYRAANNDDAQGLFTGYFEPELRGSRTQGATHKTPLYRRPPELVMVNLGQFREKLRGQRIAGEVRNGRLVPYADRAGIEGGDLSGRGLELVWVDDPVDAFFLQIQGSGRVVLDDGTLMRLGYDGQNGHIYTAIGRTLIKRGVLTKETVSLQSIAAWLRANPGEADAVMNSNRSFVFFRELTGDGPLGAQGVALTPGRSLAIDRKFLPLGAPVWLDTTDPLDPATPLRRLVVAQDTGGAIKGPVRGDLFWGAGTDAAQRAGHMKQTGGYYLLLPNTVTVPGR